MARYEDREKVLTMRKRGMSYSQIKEKIKISKSTLSLWLREHPLSDTRMRALRDNNQSRIENFRKTMAAKRRLRHEAVFKNISKEIGPLTRRELFVAGFFLYWAEGTKADPYTVMFTNTDPAMICVFLEWLALFGVKRNEVKVYLHLYSDMDIGKAIAFWSRRLGIPRVAFRKPYIKESIMLKRKNYKGRFGHGTCNVYARGRDLREKIGAGIAHIRKGYEPSSFDPISAI